MLHESCGTTKLTCKALPEHAVAARCSNSMGLSQMLILIMYMSIMYVFCQCLISLIALPTSGPGWNRRTAGVMPKPATSARRSTISARCMHPFEGLPCLAMSMDAVLQVKLHEQPAGQAGVKFFHQGNWFSNVVGWVGMSNVFQLHSLVLVDGFKHQLNASCGPSLLQVLCSLVLLLLMLMHSPDKR